MSTKSEWKLPELARAVGMSPRTVRYYIQRGLVPRPQFRGPDTVYEQEHAVLLRAIKRLQERFLPLDSIQVELASRSPEELRRLADGTEGVPVRPPRSDSRAATAAAAPQPAAPRSAGWKRWELLPGLELHLAENAGAAAGELADKLHVLAQDQLRRKGPP
jgi:DNA-binding transcriptional MerR regulator